VSKWQQKVYKKGDYNAQEQEQYDLIKQKSGNRCLCCWEIFLKKRLSLHHLIPREQGGQTIEDNLILVCGPCHDDIEGQVLSRRQIVKRNYDGDKRRKSKSAKLGGAIRWQQWVYGGYSRPGG